MTSAKLEPILINATDAAKLLGIGKSLFYQMCSDGRIGPMALRFGKKRLYRVDELCVWVRDGCKPRAQWAYREGAER